MKRESITIVLVSKSREPLTMEFSVKEIILIATFLILILGASVYSLINFKNLKSQHNRLTSTVQSLKAELAEREDRISKLLLEKSEAQKKLTLISRRDTTEISPETTTGEIKIGNLEVASLERGLSLNFNLVNSTHDNRQLAGYLMIIVEHNSGAYDKFGTFPKFAMTSGQPINYLEGDTYSIRKFKTVNAQIPLSEEPENYNSLKFLVFSEDGEILLYHNRVLEW